MQIMQRYLILIAGVILLGVMSGSYFLVYKPNIKKISDLKNRAKKSENELSQITTRVKGYKPITDEEKVIWIQTEEKLLTTISNKEHLNLLTEEIAKMAPSLDIVDMSYASLKSNPANPNPTNPENPTPTSAPEANQTSSETGKGKNLQVDYMLLNMKFYCKYGDLLDFLKSLNQLDRLISIESLSIKKSIPKISVEMTFRTYYWEST